MRRRRIRLMKEGEVGRTLRSWLVFGVRRGAEKILLRVGGPEGLGKRTKGGRDDTGRAGKVQARGRKLVGLADSRKRRVQG